MRRSLRLAKAAENETPKPEPHSSGAYPVAATAPAWFGPAVRLALAPISAILQNDRWFRKNRNALHAVFGDAAPGATALSQIAKTIPGAGPGLPCLAPVPAPDPNPAAGSFRGHL